MLSKIDDPSMKHVFISLLPEEITVETFRLIKIKKKAVSVTPLGEIFQYVLEVVEKLYTQSQYFKNLMKGTVNIKQGCKRLNLSIKCPDEKKCICPTKKKKHVKTYKFLPYCFKRRTKMSYLRKKMFQGSNKSSKCYICHKKGHYAKNYPNKTQVVKLMDFLAKKTSYDPEDEDIKRVFSLDDEPSPHTLLALKVEDSL